MGVFKLLGTEFQKLTGNKTLLLAVIGVLLVPIVYVTILLSTKMHPYDHMDNLPVAVVNKDIGGVSSGEPINVGNDLVQSLKESQTLGFEFVSSEEANKGLKNNEYYLVIEIPEDFSQKVTTVLDANPQVPELRYIKNEGLNFTASSITNSAVEKIKEQLGDKITATYAKTVFSKFGDIAEGFESGADGSSQIFDGTNQLADGTGQILSSLKEKAPDINKLAAGAQEADAGAGKLLSAVTGGKGDILKLADGSSQVAEGTKTLSGGTGQVLGGLNSLKSGSNQILTGLKDASAGTKTLVSKFDAQVVPGAQQIAGGLSSINSNMPTLDAGAKQVAGGLSRINSNMGALDAGAKQVAGGLSRINSNMPTLNTGAAQVAGGLAEINGKIDELNAGAKNVADGLESLRALLPVLSSNPSLAPYVPSLEALIQGSRGVSNGVKDVTTGIKQLAPGSEQLAEGVSEVKTGVEQLAPGAAQVAGGITDVKDGVELLAPGAAQLAGGVTAVKDGVTQLAPGAKTLSDGLTDAMPSIKGLSAGLNQLSAGQNSAVAGINDLVAGQTQVDSGVKTLANGASQVAAGNQSLTKSWNTLTNGVSDLKNGLVQISGGNQTVATGWTTLTDGVTQVSDGVVKLQDGSKELSTGLSGGAEEVSAVQVSEENINMFASPVQLKGDTVNSYEFYRDSTAPFYISLALFVGMLILSFFVDFKKPAVMPGSAIAWYVSKWLQLAIFAVVQALLVSLVTLIVLGLSVSNALLFILFTIIVSLTFMSIIFFLVAVGGHIGRFVAVAFIILQISTTGGNLPVIMLSDGIQSIAKFLPLTYSNAGFKSIISLDDTSFLLSNVWTLLIYLVLFSVLTLVVFVASYKSLSVKAESSLTSESTI